MIERGFVYTFVGMIVVFFILVVILYSIKLLNKIFPAKFVEIKKKQASLNTEDLIPYVITAVLKYRSSKAKEVNFSEIINDNWVKR